MESLDCVGEPLTLCAQLASQLHHNSMSTEELLQSYCAMRCDQTAANAAVKELCRVTLKAAYIRIVGERVLLTVHVLSGTNFPPLDKLKQSCDSYVRLELAPYSLFPADQYPPLVTQVIASCTEPVFRQTFIL